MRKTAIISIILFVLFISVSFVSAEDSLVNQSLTTSDDMGLSPDLTMDDSLSCENSEIDDKITSSESTEILKASDEISIDDSNYNNYFSSATGKFKSDVDVSKINTLKIGNVSDKLFTINKPLNIIPLSSDCQMTNSVIHLIEGSDGSNVSSLKIINDKGEIYNNGMFVCKLHGIWFTNSNYNFIYNNTIRIAEEEGCYAMPMGWSSYNRIIKNDMYTHFTCCMVMGESHYNNISYNRMEIATCRGMVCANCIYFNPYGHADYSGIGDCIGNYIFGNYIRSNSNSDWSYTVAIEAESNNTQLINNTIIGGYFGVFADNMDDKHKPHNVTIKGNTVINSTYSIWTISNSMIVSGNKITGSSKGGGIFIGDSVEEDLVLCDNIIEYDNLEFGISISANNTKVFNNIVKLSNYGAGILVDGNNISVYKNTIKVTADNGISIYGSNNLISNNFISTKGEGVVLSGVYDFNKLYNNTISFNKIYSDKYAVVINGYVYNTQIHDNVVETNKSEAFYINIKETTTDKSSIKILDNNVNGVIEDTDTIIVNDSNFYDYFDENGYLKYEFNITQKRMLFLTFLSNKNLHFTDQIALKSNKQPNLLYNVTITFSGDACDSSITDFKFYNFDKSSIILDGVENVDIKNNQFTTISSDIFDVSVISIKSGCYDSNIVDNDFFITSNANYTYAILISEPSSKIRKSFSSGLIISKNNIFIKSSGVSEGIYADALINSIISSNDISLICDNSAYGIAIANVFGRPHDIKIDSNEIIINSKEMSYLIELYMTDSIEITNNYLKGVSNGIYGVGIYNSHDIDVNNNEILVVGRNLTENKVFDSLGKGNTALYVYRTSKVNSLSQNIIDVDNCDVLTKDSASFINNFNTNYFVIAPYNYDLYFNLENNLNNTNIKENDVILFKNFTTFKTMNIDYPVLIKPYKHLNQFTSYLILSGNYSNLTVSGFNFKNARLDLNNVSNVNVKNNSFVSSEIHDLDGFNNGFLNNSFIFTLGGMFFDGSLNTVFAYNNVSVNSSELNVVLVENANGTTIFNNLFNVSGSLFNLITSNSSINNNISYNFIVINSTGDIHAYNSLNTTYDNFLNNKINVNGDYTKAVVYYGSLSSNNNVMYNNIISNTVGGSDYAVEVNSTGNIISNNYLISSNGYRRGNDAVNASDNIVRDNTPADLYVSANVNVSGNGSIESPYATIREALENAVSGSIIYVLPGCYNESNLVIDKNITLTAINQEGNTYINALNNRLFEITKKGELTVNALKIFNGFSVNGGGLFCNNGKLVINNSMLYNSSSYYDNSDPVFKADKYTKNVWHSYDCSNLGLGGAILNYGDLLIDSSNLFDNYAHKGGALADFGKTTIKNSLFYNNTGVHGGAIFTDSKKGFNVDNCYFHDNTAITTLDYCFIQRYRWDNSNLENAIPKYRYTTECKMGCGYGGAIFSNSYSVIENSLFERNTARCGGAISTNSTLEDCNGFNEVSYHNYGLWNKHGNSKLTIDNCVFRYNEVKDTRCGNATLLLSPDNHMDYFNQFFEGGAIFGSMKEFNLLNSLFEYNIAYEDGGALTVQCLNSTIEGCSFYNNTAARFGGALSLFGNYEVFNTEIMSNNARDGGGIHYESYRMYERIQNNMNMFNVTVADNVALGYGGAFLLENANFNITNSNIYGNKAPKGNTLGGKFGYGPWSIVDARNNWWGSVDGPDESIRYTTGVKYRTWVSDKIKWSSISISPSNDDNPSGNGKTNGNSYVLPSDSKTGVGVRTGSTLAPGSESQSGNSRGYNFPGNWKNSGNGNSGGLNFPGNWKYSGNGNGVNFGGDISSNSKTQIKGNTVNPESMSKINSTSVNNLASVGMTANAADSSVSSQSSSSDGGSAGEGRAYEITKDVKKEIRISDDFSIFNVLFVLLWIFLFIGFYRRYKAIDDD